MTEWKETDFGKIPQYWELKSITELKSNDKRAIAMGPFGSNIKAENFVTKGVPVIRGTNFNFDKYVDGKFVFLTEEKADELIGSNCKSGDIVFTHRGTIGQVALIPENKYKRYVISQSGMKLTVNPNLISNEFLFYFFKSDYGQFQLLKYESQVGVPSISNPLTSLKEIEVPVPPLPEQKTIASVLSSLDDKIDLLHRQNKTLEAMVETIFRQWFVEDKNSNSYRFENLVDSVSIKHKFDKDKVIFLNTSDVYDGKVLHQEYSDVLGLPGQAKKSIQKDDILFTEIRPANRRFAYIDFKAEDYVVSTKLMVLRSKKLLDTSILYLFLKQQETLDYLQMLAEARSGTFPQITFDDLKAVEIFVPKDEKKLYELQQLFRVVIEKTFHNHSSIKSLENIRNLILPKLMNGKVKIEMS